MSQSTSPSLPVTPPITPVDPQPADDLLVQRARGGDGVAFELLIRRYNQRVYRVVRSVLRDGEELQDVMQQTYVSAFEHMDQYKGGALWSTWVCRIALNETFARLRQRGRFVSMEVAGEDAMVDERLSKNVDPERAAGDREFSQLVQQAIDQLPLVYRTVLLLREVEGMTTAETAAVLDLNVDAVKTRLHRARALLRAQVEARTGEELNEAFVFGNSSCDRVVAAMWEGLNARGVARPGV